MRDFPRIPACLLAALMLSSCGYVGDPRPPSLQIPPAPAAFGVRQVGARLLGEFTVNAKATDDAPLRLDGAVVRVTQANSGAREVPVQAKPGETVPFTIASTEWAGQAVTMAARVRGVSGRWSEWSNEVALSVEPAIEVPRSVTAKLAAKGVELNWEPASAASVARRVAGESAFVPLQADAIPPWVDSTVEQTKRYEYQLQAKSGSALSDATDPVAITFEDRFPPPVPTGLDAVAGLSSIELSWDAIDDPDFSAYLIYRAAPGGDFVAMGAPTALPSFSDRTARPGVAYRYALASVDHRGNTSERSREFEIALPPQ